MPMRSHDLLAQALGLPRVNEEAQRRATVSRAYYASYHRCLEWERRLPGLGRPRSKDAGVHQQLIDRLKDPHPACSPAKANLSLWLGHTLAAQRNRRVRADYKLDEGMSRHDMEAQVEAARDIFASCDGRLKPRR